MSPVANLCQYAIAWASYSYKEESNLVPAVAVKPGASVKFCVLGG